MSLATVFMQNKMPITFKYWTEGQIMIRSVPYDYLCSPYSPRKSSLPLSA